MNLNTPLKKSFNSMIVRLKDVKELKNLIKLTEFQFYDSPIKSLSARSPRRGARRVSIL